MRRLIFAISLTSLIVICGCGKKNVEETAISIEEIPEETETAAETNGIRIIENAGANNDRTISVRIIDENDPAMPGREPTKVHGIYITGVMAGSTGSFENILDSAAGTEINTVVIDLKDDEGRITCVLDTPMVNEIGTCRPYIDDIEGLIKDLKERGIYVIARVVAFRDPYLAEMRPEWAIHLEDGSVYTDRSGFAWLDPYRREVWDYLAEIGTAAKDVGFDEVQFDYVRFSTESGMNSAVFDDDIVKGRSRTDIITEFIEYEYECLSSIGLFVSADVYGTVIGSEVDAEAVGQVYTEMAKHLDYISPMIYPSHYNSGNFGIDHPDTEPYNTIYKALEQSREKLEEAAARAGEDEHQAIVRPWLQDFTATWLGSGNYIDYGAEEVAAQIQAVKDAGYDEWMLWSASNKYHFDGVGAASDE